MGESASLVPLVADGPAGENAEMRVFATSTAATLVDHRRFDLTGIAPAAHYVAIALWPRHAKTRPVAEKKASA